MSAADGHMGTSAGATGEACLPAVLVFGGTVEGRMLVEWLGGRGSCRVVASSVTEYGSSLVADVPHVEVLTGRMLPQQMDELMASRAFSCVVDATHPYAVTVSDTIAACAARHGVPRLRVIREGEPEGPWMGVASVQEAADALAHEGGRVLLTTGSNDLAVFAERVDDYQERLFVRILPVQASLEKAAQLGIPASHIVAMQGPFSREFNAALIRELGVSTMVTKASGSAGGFWEKVEAARDCGIRLVVVNRPTDEEGLSLQEAQMELQRAFGL